MYKKYKMLMPYLIATTMVSLTIFISHLPFFNISHEILKTPYVLSIPVCMILGVCFGLKVGIYSIWVATFLTEVYVKTAITELHPGRILILTFAAGLIGYLSDRIKSERTKATESNATKTKFLAMLSHELRTPLNAIIGFSDLVLQTSQTLSETDRDNLKRVASAGRHLHALVDDLLNLSAIEAGKVQLTKELVDMTSCVSSVIKSHEFSASEKNVVLKTILNPTKTVFVDVTRIQQILNNLICNAIKYTPAGGSVTVSCYESGGHVEISIADTGIGIAEQDINKIFLPFEQLDCKKQGVGLGLAISKKLIDLHSGKLTVSSTVGQGSTFIVRLPVSNIDLKKKSKIFKTTHSC